jgi:AcrR family transcriptional regulator
LGLTLKKSGGGFMANHMSAEANRGGKAQGAYHHGNLRAALIASALAEVERGGAEAVTLSSLAKALGVSQPAPYRHFTDRDGLLATVALRGFGLYAESLGAAANDASRFTAPSRIAQAHVAFGFAHPGLYRLMFASPLASGVGPQSELGQAITGAFERLLEAVRAMGYGQGARRRAIRIWAAAHGLVMLADQPPFDKEFASAPLGALIEDIIA